METRDRNMPPVQRPPSEWEKGTLPMTEQVKQGPMVESKPTMRDFSPAALNGTPASFTDQMIASRAGMQTQAVEARAQGVFPGDVVTVLVQGQGGMIAQHLAGVGSFDSERSEPGDDGNVATGGEGGVDYPKGKSTAKTGGTVSGKTGPKGTI